MRAQLNANTWRYKTTDYVQPHLWVEIFFTNTPQEGEVPQAISPTLLLGLTLDNHVENLDDLTMEQLLGLDFLSRLQMVSIPAGGGGPPPRKVLHGAQHVLGGIIPVTGLPRTTTGDRLDPPAPTPGPTAVAQTPN
jgi:hypothetical protein